MNKIYQFRVNRENTQKGTIGGPSKEYVRGFVSAIYDCEPDDVFVVAVREI